MALHMYLGTLQLNTTGTVYADVGQIVSFDPPKQKAGDTKTTHLASASAAHTYISGFLEPDTVKATCNFVPADFATLHAAYAARSTKNWKIRYNDPVSTAATSVGSLLTFTGHINEIGDAQVSVDGSDKPIMTEIGIKLSGLPVFAVPV